MDGLTLLLAMLGGLFNGTFPIFIKTEKVLAAKVHPVIFQLYKSSWVMIVGVCCAIVRLIRGLPLAFTPWASLSAAAWIPSGVFTIIAVPLVGVGSSVLTTAATGSVLSFLVFWLGFHEPMKVHNIGGHEIVLAPFYMFGCILGMAGLVLAHQWALRQKESAASAAVHVNDGGVPAASEPGTSSPAVVESGDEDPDRSLLSVRLTEKPPVRRRAQTTAALRLRTLLGYSSAALSGVFSALQFGLVQAGQRASGMHSGVFDERFDALGSWLALFGVSALICTVLAWLLVSIVHYAKGIPIPSPQLKVMILPGSGAGIFWSLANICSTFAVLRGGNAVTSAQINAAGLITSGGWGLLYYREIRGWPAVAWIASASFSAAMAVLLGFEKAK